MQVKQIKANTAAEASTIYRAFVGDRGASEVPSGEWNGHYISYNGKVWDCDNETHKTQWQTANCIFNPYA